MYVNGMGFRAIEIVKGVHHTTIITWVKEVGELLPDSYEPEIIPQVGELDELETFIGSKKAARPRVAVRRKGMLAKTTSSGSGAGALLAQCLASRGQMRQHRVDHFKPGILEWVLGDRSAKTFEPLWEIVKKWQCYFYVTDGWKVYPGFIPDGDQIVCKTYMTRVEAENTRLRHYLARLHRKTLCYSKSVEMLKHSIRLLIHYLRFSDLRVPYRFMSQLCNA